MRRSAFTLVELLIVMAIMLILIAILIPAIDGVREEVRRHKCRANLKGFGTAFYTYAGEGNWKGRWPDCGRSDPANLSSNIDTKGSLWLLVKRGAIQPENFICPSEEVSGAAAAFTGAVNSAPTPFPRDAKNRVTISYSYQVPHSYSSGGVAMTGNPGREHPNQTRLAVMADRSPFDYPTGRMPKPGPLLLSGLSKWSSADKSTGEKIDSFINNKLTANERKSINSNNHAGAGQNVLYRDGHTEWRKTPLAGINFDNIYTRADGTNLLNRVVGTSPGDSDAPYDVDDSLLRTFPRP